MERETVNQAGKYISNIHKSINRKFAKLRSSDNMYIKIATEILTFSTIYISVFMLWSINQYTYSIGGFLLSIATNTLLLLLLLVRNINEYDVVETNIPSFIENVDCDIEIIRINEFSGKVMSYYFYSDTLKICESTIKKLDIGDLSEKALLGGIYHELGHRKDRKLLVFEDIASKTILILVVSFVFVNYSFLDSIIISFFLLFPVYSLITLSDIYKEYRADKYAIRKGYKEGLRELYELDGVDRSEVSILKMIEAGYPRPEDRIIWIN